MTSERSRIFAWGGGAALAALAAAGLVLLFVPGAARYPADDKVALVSGEETLLEIGPAATAAQMEENRRRWAGLKESERAAILRRLDRLEQLTAQERGVLAARYGELEEMTVVQRQVLRVQAEALARFEATLGRQDLAALEGLEAKARARYLAELWRGRQGQR
jgi:hypothetical protein